MSKNPSYLFCGSSHTTLGKELSECMKITLGKLKLSQFPDGEISVEIQENVWGADVFVLQSLALNPNYYLVELLILIDALKRSSAKSITLIMPYFGYCRQDRKDKQGVPITAKLVANLLAVAGITRLITIDLHAGQLEGFFEIPVDHLHAQKILIKSAKEILKGTPVIVSPDVGSIKIGEKIASEMGTELAVIKKERISPTEIKKMELIGSVTGRPVIIADDICSTGNTLVAAANLCKEEGALQIIALVTHGLCIDFAFEKIEVSPIEKLFLTNTISHSYLSPKVTEVSICSLFCNSEIGAKK